MICIVGRIAALTACLLLAGAVVIARDAGPLGLGTAGAQSGPPDCDDDGDPGTDQDEYSECYQPPPPPPRPFDPQQKLSFQISIQAAWNVCASQGTPVPFPPEQPGLPSPFPTELPGVREALQVQYLILATQFQTICGPAGAIGAWAAQMLSVDPPDPNVGVIPLPQPLPAARRLDRRCNRLEPRYRSGCRGLAATTLQYANDVRQVASLTEVMAIASNRYAYAMRLGSTKQAGADRTALKAYGGELAQALKAQDGVGSKLARLVKRDRVDVHFSARELKALRRGLGNLKGLPSWLLARFRRDSLDPAQIKATLTAQLSRTKVKPFDLTALLRRRTPTAGLIASYQSVSLSDLAQLVDALTTQGVLSQSLNIVFNDDLQRAQLACSPTGRNAAVSQFITDAATKLSGPYSALMQFAAQPLRTYNPSASNAPPTSAFSFYPTSGSVSTGSNQVSFFNSASDPDGGHVVCFSWDFGDPSSGAANASDLKDPTHAYANGGTYTVTLTVTDDDGFGSGSSSQQVTVGP